MVCCISAQTDGHERDEDGQQECACSVVDTHGFME
jgi:hypothetical protein